MRLFKRALSALLAFNMMLTLLPLNIANASQVGNTNESYAVTLLNSENGSRQAKVLHFIKVGLLFYPYGHVSNFFYQTKILAKIM